MPRILIFKTMKSVQTRFISFLFIIWRAEKNFFFQLKSNKYQETNIKYKKEE
jgi:hypothetical protein